MQYFVKPRFINCSRLSCIKEHSQKTLPRFWNASLNWNDRQIRDFAETRPRNSKQWWKFEQRLKMKKRHELNGRNQYFEIALECCPPMLGGTSKLKGAENISKSRDSKCVWRIERNATRYFQYVHSENYVGKKGPRGRRRRRREKQRE